MRIVGVPLHKEHLVRQGQANGFTVTEARSPFGAIPAHAHEKFCLTILLEGTFEETYLPIHQPAECRPGSLLARPPGEVHANRLDRDGARTLSIELDAERLAAYGAELKKLPSLGHRREEAFLDIGRAMSQELSWADSAVALALESLALELLARIVRMSQATERNPAEWLTKAMGQIQDCFRDPALRIADLAAAHNVHPVYFARAFRAAYRITPGEYVRRLRLEAGREQVMYSAEPLASIALGCGFADQSHFIRAFRRRFSVSPGRMRRECSANRQAS